MPSKSAIWCVAFLCAAAAAPTLAQAGADTVSNPGTPGNIAQTSDIHMSMAEVEVHLLAPGGTPLTTDARVTLVELGEGMDDRGRSISASGYGGQSQYEANAKKSIANLGEVMGGEYTLEVSAPGYEMHREKLTVVPGYARTRAFVKLNLFDGSSDDLELEQPGVPVLSSSARTYLELTQVALKQGKFKDATKDIQRALKAAPQNPDVHFMAGYAAEQMKDTAGAKAQYEEAVKLFPNDFAAQLALGENLLFASDPNGAIPHFEKALAVGPNSWRGHWLLAESYLQGPHDAERALAEAKRAVEVGKDKATSALVTQAIAEAFAGQRDQAKKELQAFVHNYPSSNELDRANQFITQIENSTETVMVPLSAKEVDPLDLESVAPEDMPGLPTAVDPAVPAVTQDVECDLPQVLAGAAARAEEFANNLERFSAKETVIHSLLDSKGVPKNPKSQKFDYVVSVDRTPADFVRFEEIRDGKYAVENFPGQFAVEGIPALVVVFHPKMSGDFKFTCEGLGQRGGQPAWQVRWEQRTDRPARLHSWEVQGSEYPALLKGRAWLSADSYQLLHMDVDLVQAIKPLRLEYQHMSVDYTPVSFPDRKKALWLPSKVVVYCKYQGHYFRQEHDYSDFTLFSTGVQEKQGTAKGTVKND
jgi:tetratricopeptide (TPR) repeat protein